MDHALERRAEIQASLVIAPDSPYPASITRAERRWALGFAGFVIVLTSLPYILGYALQNSAWQFTGLVFGIQDGNSYIAKMLNGAAGDWLFYTPYTAEPQQGVIMFLPYILLGKLAAGAGIHEQLVALFHLFRAIAILMDTLATYEFIALFVPSTPWRRVGTALALLGGGLGWALVVLGMPSWLNSLPLDFYSPETFGFLGVYGLPHLALGRAGLLWALREYLTASRLGGGWRAVFRLSGWWLIAGIAQPMEFGLVGLVIGLHLVGLALQNWQAGNHKLRRINVPGSNRDWARWRSSLKLAAAAGVLPGVFLVYLAASTLRDSYLRVWSEQNTLLSPHPLHYLLAYGLLLPLAWFGARRVMRRDPWSGWLLAAWVLVLPFLAYLPTNLQRRLPEGGWVAISILAVAGGETLLPLLIQPARTPGSGARQAMDKDPGGKKKSHSFLRWLALLPIPLSAFSTVFLLASGIIGATSRQAPLFRPADEVAAFQYLAQLAPHKAVVLGSFDTSNALPAWAPVRVLIGHGPESAHGIERNAEVASIYGLQMPAVQRQAWLRAWGVAYVWWGPGEKSLGGWNPAQETYLRQVYTSPTAAGTLAGYTGVQIFQVLPGELAHETPPVPKE